MERKVASTKRGMGNDMLPTETPAHELLLKVQLLKKRPFLTIQIVIYALETYAFNRTKIPSMKMFLFLMTTIPPWV